MKSYEDEPDRPLTEEELDQVIKDAIAQLENETPEEGAEREKMYAAMIANDPALKRSMDKLRELFPPGKTSKRHEAAEPAEDIEEDWSQSRPPQPTDVRGVASLEYFRQRGGTTTYNAKDGRVVEWTLKGWRYK